MPNKGPKIIFFLLCIAILFGVGVQGWTKPVSEMQAKHMAEIWLRKFPHFFSNALSSKPGMTIKSVNVLKNQSGEPLVFCFQLNPTGFILVTAHDNLKPVFAFSNAGHFFLGQPDRNMAIQFIQNEIPLRLKAISEGQVPARVVARHQELWMEINQKRASYTRSLQKQTAIYGPYLTTRWGQGNVNGIPVFNYFTPNHWSAGCVATAMAQILNYYQWPVHGQGTHQYNENDAGTIGANFDSTYYDWSQMLDDYSGGSTLPERKAVGRLTYHCGIAVNMDYAPNGSTANTRNVPDAFTHFFRFSGMYINNDSPNFFQLLRDEMIQGRPAQLAISTHSGLGHSVVADGYFDFNGYFHLNMGWLGKNDGWYDLAGSFYVSGYQQVDGAALHLFPVPEIMDSSFVFRNDSIHIAWRKSFRSHPVQYELAYLIDSQMNWRVLSSNLQDSVAWIPLQALAVGDQTPGSITFRVRAFEANRWWGWSQKKCFQLQPDRKITFQVKLGNRNLLPGETLVVRGNIPPLAGYVNSPAFEGPDSLGIYRLEVSFDYSHIGETLLYRFAIVGPQGVEMENETRQYTITKEEVQILPVVYFNNNGSAVRERTDGESVQTFQIYPNYPNPFHRKTNLRIDLPPGQRVQMTVYNILGEKIVSTQFYGTVNCKSPIILDFNQIQQKSGRPLPMGIYFVQYRSGNLIKMQKIIFQ